VIVEVYTYGGTQLDALRVALAIAGEMLVVGYVAWAFRFFGR
jgi:hypothetical protein